MPLPLSLVTRALPKTLRVNYSQITNDTNLSHCQESINNGEEASKRAFRARERTRTARIHAQLSAESANNIINEFTFSNLHQEKTTEQNKDDSQKYSVPKLQWYVRKSISSVTNFKGTMFIALKGRQKNLKSILMVVVSNNLNSFSYST